MSFFIKTLTIFSVIIAYLTLVPDVEYLPFGAESAVQTASSTINSLLDRLWFLGPIWTYAMYVIYIELGLFAWRWFKIILHWV